MYKLKKAEIKDRIREAMELRGLTQSELSEKAKIDKGQLSSYLSGKYKPRQKNIEALAKELNVDEAWLMGFDVTIERKDNPITDFSKNDPIINNKEFYDRLSRYFDILNKLSDANAKKALNYAENLLSNQQMEEELMPIAAHDRTDIKPTDEMKKHDDDIMNDEDF